MQDGIYASFGPLGSGVGKCDDNVSVRCLVIVTRFGLLNLLLAK